MVLSKAGLKRDHEKADQLLKLKDAGEDIPVYPEYADSYSGLVTDIIGAKSATRRSTGEPYQFQILDDLATHEQVAVRSGHGVGKSTLQAWAVICFLLTHPFSRVAIITPQFSRQAQFVLLAEIAKWVRRSRVLSGVLEVLADRVRVKGFGDEWAAIALPATEPDRIEGLHSEFGFLLVMDESKGISNAVFDAMQGARTGRGVNRVLLTSTPGGPTGFFYDIFAGGRGRDILIIGDTAQVVLNSLSQIVRCANPSRDLAAQNAHPFGQSGREPQIAFLHPFGMVRASST